MTTTALIALLICLVVTVECRPFPNTGFGFKAAFYNDTIRECPNNGNPCATGRGHPYRICRNDLTEEEIRQIAHIGFCTHTNRFVCVQAFGFAGCCRNPCAKLTKDPFYEGAPLVDEFGCQKTCSRNIECGPETICVDGACCETLLFNPVPEFDSEEHTLHSYEDGFYN